MKEAEFLNVVIETVFVRGWNCSNVDFLRMYFESERNRLGDSLSVDVFAEACMDSPALTERAMLPGGIMASPTAGARDEWLAIHEAGHAIVGLDAGLKLSGVRFGEGGFPGVNGFEDFDWEQSTDEGLLRLHIRVDVAGNMATLLHPECNAPAGRLSEFYDNRSADGAIPSDLADADGRASRLVRFLAADAGTTLSEKEIWIAKREIVERAEREAEGVLKRKDDQLMNLAKHLRSGPITGTAMRLLVG